MNAVNVRHFAGASSNDQLERDDPTRSLDQGNKAWVKAAHAVDGVVVLGGSRIPHFRLRVAQSHLRSDLAPSFWSMTGIALDEERFVSIPIDAMPRYPSVPEANGIQVCRWADYDDAREFPNIAFVRLGDMGLSDVIDALAREKRSAKQKQKQKGSAGSKTAEPPVFDLRAIINDLAMQRASLQFPELLWTWLGYAWGVPTAANPLLGGKAFPCTAFVAALLARIGIDITPGLASNNVCPEALWSSVKWWNEYFKGEMIAGKPMKVTGRYLVRQPTAAAFCATDQVLDDGKIQPDYQSPHSLL